MQISTGLEHLRMVATLSAKTRRATESELERHTQDLLLIGTSLSALYQASTCHRKCHGGPHILESLAGRAYNLGCSAYILICRAFYDEALNLIRSIGEISNLISLSVVDKDSLQQWLAADRNTRLREFRPAKVRQLLESQASPMLYADKDWYSSFCEKYTHVTPSTWPNLHNDNDQPHVGGVLQRAGLLHSLDELSAVLGFVAMPVCKYFDLDDFFEELCVAVRPITRNEEPTS